jgi:hypothetical protein
MDSFSMSDYALEAGSALIVCIAAGVVGVAMRRVRSATQLVQLLQDLISEVKVSYSKDRAGLSADDQVKALAVLARLRNMQSARHRRNFNQLQLSILKSCMEINDSVCRSALLRRLSEVCYECGSPDIATLALSNIFDERVIANCAQLGDSAALRQIRDAISMDSSLVEASSADPVFHEKGTPAEQLFAGKRYANGW